MCRGDIGGFVAPNRPRTKHELTKDERDPQDRQSPEQTDFSHVSPDTQKKYDYRDRDKDGNKPVGHLQPNLERAHIGKGMGIAPDVNFGECVCARVRNPRAVRRGKIENGEIAMLVPHGRAERKLQVNRDRRRDRHCFDRSNFSRIDSYSRERPPKIRGNESDHDNQSKERLGEAGVKDSDLIFQHGHAQTAEDALQNYAGERDQTKTTDPVSIFGEPEPDRENDGEKPYRGRNEAMRVLKKNPADPF